MPLSAISTDRQVLALRATGEQYTVRIKDNAGLMVQVSQAGVRTFQMRYRGPDGRQRRLGLGEYPNVSLADAIKKAGAQRSVISDGGDPSGDKAAARKEAREGDTVDDAFDAYVKAATAGTHKEANSKPKEARTLYAEGGLYGKHVKPKLGSRVASGIGHKDIKEFTRGLVEAGKLAAPSIARVGELLSSIFAYRVVAGHGETRNPVAGLAHPLTLKNTQRKRMLNHPTLRALWLEMCDPDPISKLAPSTCLAFRFLVLTMLRVSEATGALWSEIDLEKRHWIIPGKRMKMDADHLVFLSDPALAVLKEAAALRLKEAPDLVFPRVKDEVQSISGPAVAQAMERLCVRLKLPHCSPHDLRRTATTSLEEIGVPLAHIGYCLSHGTPEAGVSRTTQNYSLYQHLGEKTAVMKLWGKYVTAVVGGTKLPPRYVARA